MKTVQPETVATSAKTNADVFTKDSKPDFFGLVIKKPFFSKTGHQGSGIQAKLSVGQPGDKYEQEADAMADKVVQRLSKNEQPAHPTVRGGGEVLQAKPVAPLTTITPFVQTKCAACEEEKLQKKEDDSDDLEGTLQKKPIFESNAEPPDDEKNVQRKCAECAKEEKDHVQTKSDGTTSQNASIERSLSSSKGSGAPLPASTREQMEGSFGTDFSGVRIHEDSSAVQMSKDLNAQAFTHGSDIYFNTGKYDTNSNSGKHLLAHELTHTVQQEKANPLINRKKLSNTRLNIQRSFLGDAWDAIKDTASNIGQGIVSGISSVASAISGAVRSALKTATDFLGKAASWVVDGLSSLSLTILNWLKKAGAHVWNAIKWFGAKAWRIIKFLGEWGFEKLSLLGSNAWSFISNVPKRIWRIIVHGWHGITGTLKWIFFSGIGGAIGHVGAALKGVFKWINRGLTGALQWLSTGLKNGYAWAISFIRDPSLNKLWHALTSTLSWAKHGLDGFGRWGWEGVKGAAVWVWEGAKGFGKWIWKGLVGGLEWMGRLILYVLDFVPLLEAIQIIWGLFFRMRKLTKAEISASLEVHSAGLIPYPLVRVDEGSVIAKLSGYFSGGGYRAVTSAHILHVAPGGESLSTMVHELTHVAQYEHTGSVYMAEALHAQFLGGGYEFLKSDKKTFQHQHFWEFNREQQASICDHYYSARHGLGGGLSTADLQPYIDEMNKGKF